jgi:multiple sugar transport system substrate-binding protein
MRRRSIAAVALVLATMIVAAAATAGSAHRSSPTKLTIWVGWSAGHELTSFEKLIDEYNRSQHDVAVKVVGGIDDNKIVAAIRSGTAPDVVSSFNSYNVGNYCGSGGWIDLASLLK